MPQNGATVLYLVKLHNTEYVEYRLNKISGVIAIKQHARRHLANASTTYRLLTRPMPSGESGRSYYT